MAPISNFWQRILTGSIFLIVMIGAIVLSFQSFIILFGLVIVFATYEYIKLVSIFSSPNKWIIYVANLSTYAIVSFALILTVTDTDITPGIRRIMNFIISRFFIFLLFLFPVWMMVAELFRKKEKPFENIAYTVLGFIYIGIPFVLVVMAFSPVIGDYKFQWVLSYFLLLWISDSFAYVWGKLLGKHKLAPNISEGKTIEGTLGGIITAMGLSVLGPTLFPQVGMSLVEWIMFAGFISIFAVPSDLSESLLKRQAGVKDSGKILPGHGGILDRFDSVLLTAPIIYIYIQIITHL
jgi:phosphatidate cytidylyltransferase